MKQVLPKNQIKVKLAAGEPVYGTFVVTGEPAISEILGYAGFDYTIIDTEHAPNDALTVQHHIRASEVTGLTPLVRVTKNDESLILRVLDLGAGGVIVPQVNTALEAAAAVQAARYAPAGTRGISGVVRAARHGFVSTQDYVHMVNTETLVITQVEHIDAVKNVDEILSVEGLDGIFIGPADLSQSMGITGQFNNPKLRQVIEEVIKKGVAAGKLVAIFCLNAEDAKYWQQVGASMLCIGTDGMIFAAAARELIGKLK